jgi:2,4-dienoyl-CoA reductase-like NADH-dependent reductase (Old Yellow Enzyme family)
VDLSPLFTPVTIGRMTLKNRFIMPAMQRELSPMGVPGDDMVEYYRERAEGGVSLIIGEGVAINHPTSTSYFKYARFFGEAAEGWRRILEGVKRHDGKLFMQLWHQGAVRKENEGPHPEAPTLSPSGLLMADQPVGRAMVQADFDEIRDAYVADAVAARDMGFDGVEIHGAHGYFLDQFFWEAINRRDDAYGGDLKRRAAYPCEVVRAVRQAVGPGFPISFRISQWKTRDYEAKNFQNPDELKTVLDLLIEAGVDVFHASTRRFWTPEFPGSDMGFAGWVRALSGKPVITVGSVGLDTDIMGSLTGTDAQSTREGGLEELLRRFRAGEFDLIAVGRACLGDPHWVSKVRDQRFDELLPFSKDHLAFVTA